MAGKKWTQDELEVLCSCEGKTLSEALFLFPNRSKESIEIKGNRIGVKFKRPLLILSLEEEKVFKKIYPIMKNTQIKKRFPSLSNKQIEGLAYRLNLKKSNSREVITCSKCNMEYPNTDEYFFSYEDTTQCKECRRKHTRIKEYKNKYGIILDHKKMYESYSLVQWYGFLFKTPNGNKLSQIPFSIRSKENIIKITRSVLIEKGFYSKKLLSRITKKFLMESKLIFKINGEIINTYELISSAFPEFNIKPWEMNSLPPKYFKVDKNVLEALDWLVRKLNLTKKDLLDGYINSDILRNNGLRMISESYFNSFHDIIIFYFKHKFDEDIDKTYIMKHRKLLSKDKVNHFDSIQERIVFDFIKFNMGISNIENIDRADKRNRFFNKEINEYYYPDFRIRDHDKEIIIEYFGMYLEKPTNDTYRNYQSKTQRKISYYNSLKNIEFIGIFPSDLSNNYEGLRHKLSTI